MSARRLARRHRSRLLPDVLHHALGADLGAVDVAHGVRGDTFGRAGAGGVRHWIGDERGDGAVADPADANAALPAIVILGDRFRFGIGDVDDVVLVDEDAARPAELRPLVEVVALLIEDLDAVVLAVADEQPAARIHGQRVGNIDLARTGALLAPGLDELAVPAELHDAGVGVAPVAAA